MEVPSPFCPCCMSAASVGFLAAISNMGRALWSRCDDCHYVWFVKSSVGPEHMAEASAMPSDDVVRPPTHVIARARKVISQARKLIEDSRLS